MKEEFEEKIREKNKINDAVEEIWRKILGTYKAVCAEINKIFVVRKEITSGFH